MKKSSFHIYKAWSLVNSDEFEATGVSGVGVGVLGVVVAETELSNVTFPKSCIDWERFAGTGVLVLRLLKT